MNRTLLAITVAVGLVTMVGGGALLLWLALRPAQHQGRASAQASVTRETAAGDPAPGDPTPDVSPDQSVADPRAAARATAAPGTAAAPPSNATPAPVATQPPSTPTPTPTPVSQPPPPPPGSTHFGTLGPGAALPSGAQCAAWVHATPIAENKRMNRTADQVTGQHVGTALMAGDGAAANQWIAPRIDGQFTGTTHEILRWAACKWGIDEDIVAAQAAIESWWRQTALGDFGTDPTRCPPGHGLGVDGKPGQCPESYGILQNRYPYEQSTWPAIGNSTAGNADTAYAIWRACFEGYEKWLGGGYSAGDQWGCIGRWFSGSWHTAAAEGYIGNVKGYLSSRIWETPSFQEP